MQTERSVPNVEPALPPERIDRRIVLLAGSLTYRSGAFAEAAGRLGLEVVKGLDVPAPLAGYRQPTPLSLPLDFKDPDGAVRDLVAYVRRYPVRAIVSVDDAATVIAARAQGELGFSHNAPDATYAARNKNVMRRRLAQAGVPGPRFRLHHIDDDPVLIAPAVEYPCVVKPIMLSGSQGVIRADDPRELVAAFRRTRAIVLGAGCAPGERHIQVEEYLPGVEVVVEGILARGGLTVLALFDKPDPLVGPYFEETIYVTPSRLPPATLRSIIACAERACIALGLREGPIHAELRVNEAGPWVIEVAGRSIGGLCGKILRFGTEHVSLEELILRQAMGMDITSLRREERAGGVMMIPIPRAGILKRVEGLEEAHAAPCIEEIEITIPRNHPVTPLPEGSSYLGFIFARGDSPEEVEAALREAYRRLRFVIAPAIPLSTAGRR